MIRSIAFTLLGLVAFTGSVLAAPAAFDGPIDFAMNMAEPAGFCEQDNPVFGAKISTDNRTIEFSGMMGATEGLYSLTWVNKETGEVQLGKGMMNEDGNPAEDIDYVTMFVTQNADGSYSPSSVVLYDFEFVVCDRE